LLGGICASDVYVRVESAADCARADYLSFAENHEQILFNPDFLDYIKDFSSLRFMNWMQAIDSPVAEWTDNLTLTSPTWSPFGNRLGVPIEVMIALSNLTGIDPWFTFPHLASDDYIRRFAEHVKANLAPGIVPYIEYSNEVWNGQYQASSYAAQRGLDLGLHENRAGAGNRFYSQRSVEIFKIWESVYDGDTDRFTRVLATQFVSAFRSNMILEFEDAFEHTDALAVAPYFRIIGGDVSSLQTLDDVFAGIDASFEAWRNSLDLQAAVAEQYSVDLIAYEGGQNLVGVNGVVLVVDTSPYLLHLI